MDTLDTTPADEDESDAMLRRDITALLAAKKGIDETQAKRLRKQWNARQNHRDRRDASDSSDAPDAGEASAALAALFEQLRRRVHAQVALRETQFAQVEDKLRRLQTSLAHGDVKESQRLEQLLIHELNQIAGLSSQRRQKIITELETLRPKLNKLADWRKWSTLQAREKIIEEIRNIHQSSPDSSANPAMTLPQIAQRIQRARAQWQEWDQTGEGGHAKLYAVFDRECVTAYGPCQTYFNQQKQQRRLGSEAREKICAALEQAYAQAAWRDADWKLVQQLVHTQTNQWRGAAAADYKQRKPLQRRFHAITAKFEEKLERERQRSCKMREKLIEDIVQLAQRPDLDAAIAELQALKKSWVVTVPQRRHQERALWKRFTAGCDQLYEKRASARAESQLNLRRNLSARESMCAEIEAACHAETAAIQTQLGQWKNQWARLGEAPKAAQEKINRRFRTAIQQARQTLVRIDLAQKTRQLDLLREKSRLCALLEALALSEAADNPQRAAELTALTERWASLESLPDALEKRLGERHQLATDAALDQSALRQLSDSLPANLNAMHKMLLQLEILAEVDSPEEFAKQRMALRIGKLSTAMGKGEPDEETQSAEQLMRDILLLGALEQDQLTAAVERFDRCRHALALTHAELSS